MTGGPGFEREPSFKGAQSSTETFSGLIGPPESSKINNSDLAYVGNVATIADLDRFVDKIQALERLERDHLLTLAAMGATNEAIAEAAITMTVARFPSPPPFGTSGWGATPAEVGRAVVEALRLCGRMPKTQDQQRGEAR